MSQNSLTDVCFRKIEGEYFSALAKHFGGVSGVYVDNWPQLLFLVSFIFGKIVLKELNLISR